MADMRGYFSQVPGLPVIIWFSAGRGVIPMSGEIIGSLLRIPSWLSPGPQESPLSPPLGAVEADKTSYSPQRLGNWDMLPPAD